MLFWQLVGTAIQFCVNQQIQQRLGLLGLALLALVAVGVRVRHIPLACWAAAALLVVLLTAVRQPL
ncbi:hypothetical protein [Streptomyces sp. NPDC060027]|uniref:hypothetical protein n=1 Tax=Streptomyces sp. NPDC060027 TaxID=3347040 RepID=UPI0036D12924